MTSLADRFEAKVDRSGEHHLWLGSKKTDGTGKLKVDGRTRRHLEWNGSWLTGRCSPARR